MSIPKERNVGYQLHYISRNNLFTLDKHMGPYGVAHGQFPVLRFLWISEGQTQAELRKKVLVEQPTLANTLKRMERDNLVKRIPDENDKRQTRIYLTEYAKELMPKLLGITDNINASILQCLTDKEKTQFISLLEKIYQNVAGTESSNTKKSK